MQRLLVSDVVKYENHGNLPMTIMLSVLLRFLLNLLDIDSFGFLSENRSPVGDTLFHCRASANSILLSHCSMRIDILKDLVGA